MFSGVFRGGLEASSCFRCSAVSQEGKIPRMPRLRSWEVVHHISPPPPSFCISGAVLPHWLLKHWNKQAAYESGSYKGNQCGLVVSMQKEMCCGFFFFFGKEQLWSGFTQSGHDRGQEASGRIPSAPRGLRGWVWWGCWGEGALEVSVEERVKG